MKQLLLAISIMVCLTSYGQNVATQKVSLTGLIKDKKTGQALSYATVSLQHKTDSTQLTGALTDENGRFSITTTTGSYLLKVEFMGFKAYENPNFELLKDSNLPTVFLEEDLHTLNEVEVTAEKTSVEYKLDKKVFNVGKDLLSKGGTANDILDNVPSVTVDAAGGISLRGNNNVQILINGKPSIITLNNGLEQIPSESIEKIEVITNPSARYEAQGTAGIINIILKKNRKSGFNGSIQLGTGIPDQHTASLNLNYKSEKFNVFSTLGYRYSNFFGGSESSQTIFQPTTLYIDQMNDQQRNDNAHNYRVGAEYFINDKNTINFSISRYQMDNDDFTTITYNYLDEAKNIERTEIREIDYFEPMDYKEANLTYTKLFSKEGQKLTVDVNYDWWYNEELEDISYKQSFPTSDNYQAFNTRNYEASDDLTIQSDLVFPISKDQRIEAGLRFQTRDITSDYYVKEELDGQFVTLGNFDNKMLYEETISAAYAQYGNKFGKLNYLFGLRMEHSSIRITDRINELNLPKDYYNFFPTVHFNYQLNEKDKLQLSYSRRISRPQFWQLNPFGGFSDVRDQFRGNPDLNPNFTDAFEFEILKTSDKFTVNPSVYFQETSDFFQFIVSPDEEGYLITTLVNLGIEQRLGLELSTTYNPFKWWRLSGDFNFYKFKQRGQLEGKRYDADNQTWTARINNRFKLPKKFTIQGSFNYQGKSVNAQYTSYANHYADLAISKDIMKDRANISFRAINMLDSRRRILSAEGEGFLYESESWWIGRRLSLNFTYKFDQLKN
ncbi:outer membrane beta-barrel family protein [Sediminitomix flava]|uniref:Outer membrane receptor protein involved in Fe transport n=1 Tax=Sediminitomix flava TaxID=379075 RepID=A0A315ZDB8_SEDFL|nr:outer membrane beta-barrel family protein [Sediminitomix flava]PWJ43119.1 outer membrane receptor protein involved in Fe transport [Sediminitomix flava]